MSLTEEMDRKYPNIQSLLPPTDSENVTQEQNRFDVPNIAMPPGQTLEQAAIDKTRPPNILTGAREGAYNAPETPAAPKNNQQTYEDYLKIFQNTLPDKPELDVKKRKRLATVAAINALGQSLRQAVSAYGAKKYDAPIAPLADPTALQLLGQYNKEETDYDQKKMMYDRMKTQTMQDAYRYAYGDKQSNEHYQRQLDLMNKQQEYSTNRDEGTQKFQAEQQKKTQEYYTNRDKTQMQNDLDKIDKQYGKEIAVLGERVKAEDKIYRNKLQADMETLEKSGLNSNGLYEAAKVKEAPFPVYDTKTGADVLLSAGQNWYVLTQELNRMNIDIKTYFEDPTMYNSPTVGSKVIVTNAWRTYFEPQYDNNRFVGMTGRGSSEAGQVGTWIDNVAKGDSTKTQQEQVTKPEYFQ